MDEWEKYELHHRKRLAIKPGLTGMWQVSGRSDITDFEEVVELDTKYIAEWCLKRDILNICKETGCELKQLPGVYQLVNGEVSLSKMKKVAVEDLLGRDTIKVNIQTGLFSLMRNLEMVLQIFWQNRKIRMPGSLSS